MVIDDSQVVETKSKKNKIDDDPHLNISIFNQSIDDHWSLSSFSSLVRGHNSYRQEEKDRQDSSPIEAQKESNKTNLEDEEKPLRFRLKKGADSGNLLHDILEYSDFSKPEHLSLDSPLQRFGGLADKDQDLLAQWLYECLLTPLPPINPDNEFLDNSNAETNNEKFTLADLQWSQTLRETEFYFPLIDVSMHALSLCLQQYRADGKPVQLPEKSQLSGMMRGFIDLIFEYQGRFYVADYKSTHLGDHLEDYHWQALKENNQRHYYDLQYLIYSLALHRYLACRIPDYDPEIHFGGVYYLYLRGMSQHNQQNLGVFHTAISVTTLKQLDQVFHGETIGGQL